MHNTPLAWVEYATLCTPMDNHTDTARQRIQEAKEKASVHLDLSDLQLTALPKSLFELTALTN